LVWQTMYCSVRDEAQDNISARIISVPLRSQWEFVPSYDQPFGQLDLTFPGNCTRALLLWYSVCNIMNINIFLSFNTNTPNASSRHAPLNCFFQFSHYCNKNLVYLWNFSGLALANASPFQARRFDPSRLTFVGHKTTNTAPVQSILLLCMI
jgi:hypothetical protein